MKKLTGLEVFCFSPKASGFLRPEAFAALPWDLRAARAAPGSGEAAGGAAADGRGGDGGGERFFLFEKRLRIWAFEKLRVLLGLEGREKLFFFPE